MAAAWESAPLVGADSGGGWQSAPLVKPAEKQPDQSLGGTLRAVNRGMADTLSFGLMDRAVAAAGAGIDWAQGKGFDYSQQLEKQRAGTQQTAKEHPIAFTGGQLAGGLALPAGAAAEGASLAGRMGRGALAGAGMGAAFGASGAPDLTNIPDVAKRTATGAAVGGAFGGLAPPVVEGAIGAGKFIANRAGLPTLRGAINPGAEAERRVTGALKADVGNKSARMTPAGMQLAQKEGQPVILADAGGATTKALARSAANTSPEARASLSGPIFERFADKRDRVASYIMGEVGGENATAHQTLEKLHEASRNTLSPLYKGAYEKGASMGLTDEIGHIMEAPAVQSAVKDAIKTAGNKDVALGLKPVKAPFEITPDGTIKPKLNADGSVVRPSLQFFDHVKRNLDDQASKLFRAGEKNAGGDIAQLKNLLLSALDNAVPEYATARGAASVFKGAESAVDKGRMLIRNTGSNEQFAKEIENMTEPDKQLLAIGAASELADKVRGRASINALFNNPAARERIELGMGKQSANRLETIMHTEESMDIIKNAVEGGSTTVRQLAEAGLAGGAAGAYYSKDWKGGLTGGILGALARHGATKIDARVAAMVGEKLASSDPATYELALKKIEGNEKLKTFFQSITSQAVKAVLPQVMWQLRGWKTEVPPAAPSIFNDPMRGHLNEIRPQKQAMSGSAGSVYGMIDKAAFGDERVAYIMKAIYEGEDDHKRGKFSVGDHGASFGPFQMDVEGGRLGAQFHKQTGLDPKNPKNTQAVANWVAQYIKKRLAKNPNYNPGREWFGYPHGIERIEKGQVHPDRDPSNNPAKRHEDASV
jgi:hypothetical protein